MTFQPLISPGVLTLLALVLLGLCVWGYLRSRGPRKALAPGVPKRREAPAGLERAWLRWSRRLLISALLVFAFAGPSVPAEEIEVTSNVEIVLAVDRTGSMAAEDGPDGAPRLDAVRRDIMALVDSTAGARYAVVTWDSGSRVELPFTTDGSAIASFARVLHQEISEFSAGSSMSAPVPTLEDLLRSAAEQRPQNVRYLVVFSDGEPTGVGAEAERSELGSTWSALAPHIDGGAVIGYGTEQGGQMRRFLPGGAAEDGDLIMDGAQPAVSRIDVPALEAIADSLGVGLLVNPDEQQVRDLGERLSAGAEEIGNREASRFRYRYIVWAPAAAIALLLVWEGYAAGREAARLRRSGAI